MERARGSASRAATASPYLGLKVGRNDRVVARPYVVRRINGWREDESTKTACYGRILIGSFELLGRKNSSACTCSAEIGVAARQFVEDESTLAHAKHEKKFHADQAAQFVQPS
jgi:hypothetical protein